MVSTNSRALANAGRARFDGWVTYAEDALHLLDRTMGTHESCDEDLVVGRKTGELWKFETAFDSGVHVDHTNSLRHDSVPLRYLGQLLQVF